MKQILQDLQNGTTEVAEVPCPIAQRGHLLVRTHRSLISAGTERMVAEFGRANLIQKARQQPDKVRMVLEKVRTDGVLATLAAVRSKLSQPLAMGYCNVGTVIEVGPGVSGFEPGDRVASNGKHAQVVSVPVNLCAKVPEGVSDDEAAFTVLGAIALQGIRLVQPTLGEAVVVMGLGLIGLLAVQLLRAQGCRVLGVDLDSAKLEIAARFGAQVANPAAGEDPIAAADTFSRGRGVDAVIITAATKSSEPVHQAAVMSRKRGRLVLVGVTGLELSRADFYEKELSFQVSCSYGPGRYDPEYELKGHDYPIGFVRWTEQRNLEAVLDMFAERRIDVAPLVSQRFGVERAAEAYELLTSERGVLGIVLDHAPADAAGAERLLERIVQIAPVPSAASGAPVSASFIGAGNYALQMLIPAFREAGARLRSVASAGGVSSAHAARKFGFEQATTDYTRTLADSETTSVVICTRHDSHARLVCESLEAGKAVFVEKPLAITRDELDRIEQTYRRVTAERGRAPLLMVGFNRRFAPHVVRVKELLRTVSAPKSFVMTVNAGAIPVDHWTQDSSVGGGRIVGEGCHFIDLLRFLADAPIVAVQAMMIGEGVAPRDDNVTFTMRFADGSFGTVHYLAQGHKSFPKERLEVFCAGRILQLDNFRRLTGYGWPGLRSMNLWGQDKGHRAGAKAFLDALGKGAPSPIPFDELLEVTRVSFDVADQLRGPSPA